MTGTHSIPQEFGGSWGAFTTEWCCGTSLGYDPAEIGHALSTLVRLWPAEVARLQSDPARGVTVIAPAVELGCLFNACELAESFEEVVGRLVGGERSAYSELVLVAALRRLGLDARFAAPIGGRVLDATCVVNTSPVYFEVVAPERSVAAENAQRIVNVLTAAVRQDVSRCRVEIELLDAFDESAISRVREAIKLAKSSVWTIIESVARLRRTDVGESLSPAFDGDGTQIFFGADKKTQGASTSVIARWESSDVRAKRVFNDKYRQLGPDVANILVVNVCAVTDGFKAWPIEMARLLQPSRNRKVGAVAFFEQGCIGSPEAIRRRWRILVNPHAHLPAPEAVLSGLESLDESTQYGVAARERIVAD